MATWKFSSKPSYCWNFFFEWVSIPRTTYMWAAFLFLIIEKVFCWFWRPKSWSDLSPPSVTREKWTRATNGKSKLKVDRPPWTRPWSRPPSNGPIISWFYGTNFLDFFWAFSLLFNIQPRDSRSMDQGHRPANYLKNRTGCGSPWILGPTTHFKPIIIY